VTIGYCAGLLAVSELTLICGNQVHVTLDLKFTFPKRNSL